jgi:hypothetical protein
MGKEAQGIAAYAKKGNTAGISSLLIPREGPRLEMFRSNYKSMSGGCTSSDYFKASSEVRSSWTSV